MRGLGHGLAALAIAGLGLGGATTATAQADDDWEFAEDAARSLTVAAVRYDSGHAVIAQCANGQLRVLLAGLPATTETSRLLAATRSGGATDTLSWTIDEGGSLTSTLPARDARFLRAGGGLRLRSAPRDSAPINAAKDTIKVLPFTRCKPPHTKINHFRSNNPKSLCRSYSSQANSIQSITVR